MVGAWWAAVYGVSQSRIQLKRLSSSSSSAVEKAKAKAEQSKWALDVRKVVSILNRMVIEASLVLQTVKNLPPMLETRIRSPGREDPPEKGLATLSSILAWGIPWTEEPGELQFVGCRAEPD